MSSGRTIFWPKDSAWWRRGRVGRLLLEHGVLGPAVLDWLTCEARTQGPLRRHDGTVKAGYSGIAVALLQKDPEAIQAVVQTAARIGALDDLTVSTDGETFTCRISGWQDDIERPLESLRKAGQRAEDDAPTPGGQRGTTGDNGGPRATRGEKDKDKDSSSSLRSEGRAGSGKGQRPDPESLPDGFPSHLTDVLERVLLPALTEVAEVKQAIEPTRRSVAALLSSLPKKRHDQHVEAFKHWSLYGAGAGRQQKDVVAAYRNWAGKEPDVAGLTAVPGGRGNGSSGLAGMADRQAKLLSNGGDR